jgi:hypothetical protein
MGLDSHEFKWGGLHEKNAIATKNLGVKTVERQETPSAGTACLRTFRMHTDSLASSPANKSTQKIP